MNDKPALDWADPVTLGLAMFAVFYVVTIILALLAFRLFVVLPNRVTNARVSTPGSEKEPLRKMPVSLLVVLGSGGHSKEMLTMLRGLDPQRYHPIVFVRAVSDTRSEGMLKTTFASLTTSSSSDSNFLIKPSAILTVPRARSVGQSWFTTPFTTLQATVASLMLVAKQQPDVILCNGPGTCLPICLAGYVLRFWGLKHVKVIFVESFCRVQSLSLTGRLLYRVADRFIVQWQGLKGRYPQAEYLGQLC
ncbi:udp-n-acetylglucosamine transferase subunit alg14 homolog [Nannochloropsis oceanica]